MGLEEYHDEREFRKVLARYKHLARYVEEIRPVLGKPVYIPELSRDIRKFDVYNIIYPAKPPVFIHVYKKSKDSDPVYTALEPKIESRKKRRFFESIKRRVLIDAYFSEPPKDEKELEKRLDDYVERYSKKGFGIFEKRLPLTNWDIEVFKYLLKRDVIFMGPIEPLIRDPYIEDISCTGTHPIAIVHKIFENVFTNIKFESEDQLNQFLRRISEKIGRTASEANPIIDGVLPDGSRINIIYGTDVSKRGSAFTIRKFEAIPLSVTQLVKMNTMSAEEAAYLWLAIEHGMNVFVCGETASGKTTTLRALSVFINPSAKVFSVEDTPEVTLPHNNWIETVTKEGVVDMYDLLKAALRSRPNYIIVGEIRGREGYVAFQAMQTGSSAMATFHAGSLIKLVQRFTGKPINIPLPFLDNLNIVVFQSTVTREGKMERRVMSIEEIEGFRKDIGRLVTRRVFEWDPVTDSHRFVGINNSYILEERVAKIMNLPDPKEIYVELKRRARIIEDLIRKGVLNYWDVWDKVRKYVQLGIVE